MGNSSFLRLLFFSSLQLIGRSPRIWGGGHLLSPRAQTPIFSGSTWKKCSFRVTHGRQLPHNINHHNYTLLMGG